jgi:hypothetical protein
MKEFGNNVGLYRLKAASLQFKYLYSRLIHIVTQTSMCEFYERRKIAKSIRILITQHDALR